MKSQVLSDDFSPGRISLRYPVALKLLSRDASHKTDIGGVRLNIRNKKDLLRASAEMKSAIKKLKPRPAVDGFLVQEMAKEGAEFFVGGRRDSTFGPIVMVGLGGIYIEIFKDTAIRLAPVTKREAKEMLQELKAYPLLQGARGEKRADINALFDVICRVSFMMTAEAGIGQIDLNPVIVHPQGQGVSIVDARVFFEK